MSHLEETRQLLEIWSRFPLEPGHGVSSEDLASLEDKIGASLPKVWRDWLSRFGRHPTVLGCEEAGDGFTPFEFIGRPDPLGRPRVFAIAGEAQENWHWGIRRQDLGKADPGVWLDGEAAWLLREDDGYSGREEEGLVETLCPTSRFLVGFLARTLPFEAFCGKGSTLRQDVSFHRVEDDGTAKALIDRFGLKLVLDESAAWGWLPLMNEARDIAFVRHWGVAAVNRDLGL